MLTTGSLKRLKNDKPLTKLVMKKEKIRYEKKHIITNAAQISKENF